MRGLNGFFFHIVGHNACPGPCWGSGILILGSGTARLIVAHPHKYAKEKTL